VSNVTVKYVLPGPFELVGCGHPASDNAATNNAIHPNNCKDLPIPVLLNPDDVYSIIPAALKITLVYFFNFSLGCFPYGF
jgi:hypothetical protein